MIFPTNIVTKNFQSLTFFNSKTIAENENCRIFVIETNAKTTVMKLTGTEKQINYANDLINQMQAKVDRVTAKGRPEKRKDEKSFLENIQDGDNAGNIIDVINNFSDFAYGVEEKEATTWRKVIENPAAES